MDKHQLLDIFDPSTKTRFLTLSADQAYAVENFRHTDDMQALKGILLSAYYSLVFQCAVPRKTEDHDMALGAAAFCRAMINLLEEDTV